MIRTLGVCYYPEQWDEAIWSRDAARMVDLGLTWVRIGEFAWSRIEPEPGRYDWGWLDRAVDVLTDAGLRVVMGTPTATPPRWMLDRHPDMLACDADGRPRGFGARRHDCFSHAGYAKDCDRIVTAMADRYGHRVAAWQTDNEYGCHDTVLSYSDAARDAFRAWLSARYGTVAALNDAWGNVFWSMEYSSFDQVDLPNLTVTEPNPAHGLAFRRFSSDQVRAFNARQVAILRARTPAPLAHNYMGRVTDFDHYAVGDDLDIASWDSYPLGFLEDRVGADPAHQAAYARQGDPDFQAFHHDLYRTVGRGRWWVMEQQPGPVNWAPYNPAPLPGMVRFWTWEAFAHGAETVCYFRWRQAPFAQEQMHAGLLRSDDAPSPAWQDVATLAEELAPSADPKAAPATTPKTAAQTTSRAPVGLIFDYDAEWAWAAQPQGRGLSYFALVLDIYRCLRRLGQSVDILRPDGRDLQEYSLVCVPGLMHLQDGLRQALEMVPSHVLLGPRTGVRDREGRTAVPFGPGLAGLDARVTLSETLRPDTPMAVDGGGAFVGWREALEGAAEACFHLADGRPAMVETGRLAYLAGWPDDVLADRVLARGLAQAGLTPEPLPPGVRRRNTATERFWFNHNSEEVEVSGRILPAAGVWREEV
ncbi:MAG: beta-galactosidase [Pseudomonadota bacterium]